jgi:hypothetical protein
MWRSLLDLLCNVHHLGCSFIEAGRVKENLPVRDFKVPPVRGLFGDSTMKVVWC